MKTFEAEKKTVLSHKFTPRMKSFFSAFTTNFNFVSSTLRFLRSSGKTTAFWTAAKQEKARQFAMEFFYLTFHSKSTPNQHIEEKFKISGY